MFHSLNRMLGKVIWCYAHTLTLVFLVPSLFLPFSGECCATRLKPIPFYPIFEEKLGP
jgi:hypothetical protein